MGNRAVSGKSGDWVLEVPGVSGDCKKFCSFMYTYRMQWEKMMGLPSAAS